MASSTAPLDLSKYTSTFTTPNNLTYTYIHIPPTNHNGPPKTPILLLHGWPSLPTDFTSLLTHLHHLNHPIIAPYLLGYAPTSTPRNPTLYRLKPMAADLTSLIAHLNIRTLFHGIGHDWGATLLSRTEYYHPHLFKSLSYLTIGPAPFGQPFGLDMVNTMTKNQLGYEAVAYQKFIMDDPDRAARLMEENHERMDGLMFAADAGTLWKDYVCSIGGVEKWLTSNGEGVPELKDVKLADGVTDDILRRRKETFAAAGKPYESNNRTDCGKGYRASLNWYVSFNRNLNVDDERAERQDWETYKTEKDVLLVMCDRDPIALPAMMIPMIEGYVKDRKQLRVEHVDASHFLMLEKGQKVNELLKSFFRE